MLKISKLNHNAKATNVIREKNKNIILKIVFKTSIKISRHFTINKKSHSQSLKKSKETFTNDYRE